KRHARSPAGRQPGHAGVQDGMWLALRAEGMAVEMQGRVQATASQTSMRQSHRCAVTLGLSQAYPGRQGV
ncbi:MAG: hypothetical protein RR100_14255, partial [Comamonas sp.]